MQNITWHLCGLGDRCAVMTCWPRCWSRIASCCLFSFSQSCTQHISRYQCCLSVKLTNVTYLKENKLCHLLFAYPDQLIFIWKIRNAGRQNKILGENGWLLVLYNKSIYRPGQYHVSSYPNDKNDHEWSISCITWAIHESPVYVVDKSACQNV